MSLGITIDVNGRKIIELYAQRVTNTSSNPGPDDVSEYLITKVTEEIVWVKQYDYERERTATEVGRIRHRYGDGASVLARKVFYAAEEQV